MTKKSSPAKKTSAAKKDGGKVKEKKAAKEKPPEKAESYVHVFPEWCKGCGICVAFCPVGVLEMKDQKAVVAHPDKCVKCYLCARRCPDFAIGIQDSNGHLNGTQDRLNRLPGADEKGEGDQS